MTTTSETLTRFPAPDLSPAALAEVTAQVAATAEQYDRSGEIPTAGLLVAHRAGLLTATVGTEFGGPGLGPAEAARILIALGEGDPSVALLAANTLAGHAAHASTRHWPRAVYDDLLTRSLTEPALINAIRAEADLGAPARGGLPTTTVTRAGQEWILQGHKVFATGGEALAYHIVWALADDGRVGHVVLPGDSPGITWRHTWDHLGLRASNTHDVTYTDVRVPLENFIEIPKVDGVYRDPAANAGLWSFGHSALYIGVARAARAAFVDFAQNRVPSALGRPIATTERIQAVAGEIDTQIAIAETLLFGALTRALNEEPGIGAQLSVIKVAVARAVVNAVQTAVAALGNPGLTRHNSLERHLRDVLCVRVHPPQEDSALIAAGRRILAV
ncbi:MAG: acyl-CoA dehydrogenase family protein [Gordonia sp. (in: high G+C Gram-positive bacteria)]